MKNISHTLIDLQNKVSIYSKKLVKLFDILHTSASERYPFPLGSNCLKSSWRLALSSSFFTKGNLAFKLSQSMSAIFFWNRKEKKFRDFLEFLRGSLRSIYGLGLWKLHYGSFFYVAPPGLLLSTTL